MYRFNAEDPGQSLYTPTTVGVIMADKCSPALVPETAVPVLVKHATIRDTESEAEKMLQKIRGR